MTAPPTRTARLSLRLPNAGDHADLLALDSDPEVMRYIGDGAVRDDPAEVHALIERVRCHAAEHPGLGIFVSHTLAGGAFVGWSAIKPLDGRDEIEVGYRLARSAWGRGYATELARALVAHGFDGLGLELLVGITHPDNRASQRVLEKAGMQRVADDHCYGNPVWRYELARVGWRGVPGLRR